MKTIICFLLICLFAGCSDKNDVSNIKDVIKIDYSKKVDSYTALKVNISGINKIIPYKSNMVLVDYKQKVIYMCDYNFNVLSTFELMKNYDYIFKGRISDVFLYEDTLYISDDGFVVKKFNLLTGVAGSIELKVKYFQGFPYNLFVNSKKNIIVSFGCLYNSAQDKIKGEYFWGGIYDSLGNAIKPLMLSKADFGHDQINSDYAYYTEYDKMKYVCFKFSKNVIKLDSADVVEDSHALVVDKEWTKPYINKDKGVYGKNVNYQPIIKYNNYFLSMALPEESSVEAKIILYDTAFNPIKAIILNGIKGKYWYNIVIVDNKMILYNTYGSFDSNIYLYDLTEINKKAI